jgi:serine/threonine-protein kinase HipA
VIDGCQALGLSSAFKYERPYGSGPDVKHIRDGASLPAFFEFLKSSRNPAVQRLQMLRWVIFQVLIGNTDAHAKNLSFFCSEQGCELAPAYDLVSTLAFSTTTLEDSFSMSIGDAFLVQELSPYEWANFAVTCGLSPKLVATELKKLASKVLDSLAATTEEVLAEGADRAVVDSVCSVIRPGCLRQMNIAGDITKIDVNALL